VAVIDFHGSCGTLDQEIRRGAVIEAFLLVMHVHAERLGSYCEIGRREIRRLPCQGVNTGENLGDHARAWKGKEGNNRLLCVFLNNRARIFTPYSLG
jgi:hypothetical protein